MARYTPTYIDDISDSLTNYFVDDEGNYVGVDSEGNTRDVLLERVAEERSRLDSISNVYETADKIVTSEDIKVSVVNNPDMDTTATNNGREIVYNSSLIEDLDTDTIVSMHGTNFHELAHILFTPRQGSALGQYVEGNNMTRAFNILEEARIERMLIAKYPATRLYLEATVLEYGLKDSPDKWGDMFPVITGRRYLDIELRQMIADKFINSYGAPLAQEVSRIVNEYASLSFPTDFTKGMELIKDFTDIIGSDIEPPKRCGLPSGHSHTHRKVPKKGRPKNAKEQERLQGTQGNTPSKSENLSGTPKFSENAPKGDTPSMGVGGESEGYKGAEYEYTEADTEIAKKLSERLKDIHSDSRVKSDVRDIRKAITGNDETRNVLKESKYYDSPVSTNARVFARRFGMELERMVRDSDPHWERFLPSGKLNVSRTMTPDVNAIGQMFDVWDTGNENTDIEAVILLDNSGSMSYHMGEVCEKSWIIKRGIEAIDGSVTVFNFHSYSETLYSKKDKAKPNEYRRIHAMGSTSPLNALVEAERILNTTDKTIKMLFIVTDGDWEATDVCDSIIKRLNDKGVMTCVVFMGNYKGIHDLMVEAKQGVETSIDYLKRLKHGAKVFKAVAKPKDVLDLAVELVKSKVGK